MGSESDQMVKSLPLQTLFNSHLVMVTGKGGTGKSSLASAIGSMSAAHGRRTIVAEVDSFQPALERTLGAEPSFAPREIRKNLYVTNITWRDALNDWLKNTIAAEKIVRMILKNRVVQLFLDATPGVRETVILSRICALADEYDQVVVDMPASGHALAILRVPHIATSLLKGGPIRERSEQIISLLGDSATSMCIVGLPEEMVVNETIELWGKLKSQNPELGDPLLFLNRSSMPSSTMEEKQLLLDLSNATDLNAEEEELLLAGRREERLEESTAEALSRLEEAVNCSIINLPRLGALGGLPPGSIRITEQMQTALERERARERSS